MNITEYQNHKQLHLNIQDYLINRMFLLQEANIKNNPLMFDRVEIVSDWFYNDETNFQALSCVKVYWGEQYIVLDVGDREWGNFAWWLKNVDAHNLFSEIIVKYLVYPKN
jgi:hypothetical protein